MLKVTPPAVEYGLGCTSSMTGAAFIILIFYPSLSLFCAFLPSFFSFHFPFWSIFVLAFLCERTLVECFFFFFFFFIIIVITFPLFPIFPSPHLKSTIVWELSVIVTLLPSNNDLNSNVVPFSFRNREFQFFMTNPCLFWSQKKDVFYFFFKKKPKWGKEKKGKRGEKKTKKCKNAPKKARNCKNISYTHAATQPFFCL